jgi:hypothetical protein
MYRVGPLARLNIIDRCGTPKADQEWAEFRAVDRRAVLSSFYYHCARLIEIVYSLESIRLIIDDPDILDKRVRASAGVNAPEGIGVSEEGFSKLPVVSGEGCGRQRWTCDVSTRLDGTALSAGFPGIIAR